MHGQSRSFHVIAYVYHFCVGMNVPLLKVCLRAHSCKYACLKKENESVVQSENKKRKFFFFFKLINQIKFDICTSEYLKIKAYLRGECWGGDL